MNEIVLQSILGTDNKNPYLSIFQEQSSKRLYIYYGAKLLETVTDDTSHIGLRTAAGRLYNAGLNRKVLSNLFKVDRRTIQSWGSALLNSDPQEALRILSGRRNRKMTPEIIQFVRVRFFSIYPENRYSYSKQIVKELKDVFQCHICSETIRPLLSQYKDEMLNIKNDKKQSEGSDKDQQRHASLECEKSTVDRNSIELNDLSLTSNCNNRNGDVSGVQHQLFIHHAGICLFALYITQIGEVFGTFGSIVKQWLCMFFLEAVNIEQSKYLDFNSLSHLIGKTNRNSGHQRSELNAIANEHHCGLIFKLNAELCNCKQYTDFYYDPHTKHYTGISKILKGWCSSIGHADKVLHSDFIHSPNGEPLFMIHCDNYYDLRERYQYVVSQFRQSVGIESSKCITFTIDRGIYSQKVLDDIQQDPTQEIITWEKDFKPCDELWQKNEITHFCIKKYRNNSKDYRIYTFSYIDMRWDKNRKIRRLIVRATNPNGRTVELGVLATDTLRSAQEIISLIFKRWIQENDFKYLEKHYGINQIISYNTINYAELKPLLDDKYVLSGSYKALLYDKSVQEKKLKDSLYKKYRQDKKKNIAQQKLIDIENNIHEYSQKKLLEESEKKLLLDIKKKRRTFKTNLSRWNKSKLNEEIINHEIRLEELILNLNNCKKEESKLDTLVNENYHRLDIRKKRFMDVLKIYARNIFYHGFDQFKTEYDNYRDDHQYFRNLTHANGILKETDKVVEIALYPLAHLQPKTRKIMENILNDLNEKTLKTMDGSGRKLILKLLDTKVLKVAIV